MNGSIHMQSTIASYRFIIFHVFHKASLSVFAQGLVKWGLDPNLRPLDKTRIQIMNW